MVFRISANTVEAKLVEGEAMEIRIGDAKHILTAGATLQQPAATPAGSGC